MLGKIPEVLSADCYLPTLSLGQHCASYQKYFLQTAVCWPEARLTFLHSFQHCSVITGWYFCFSSCAVTSCFPGLGLSQLPFSYCHSFCHSGFNTVVRPAGKQSSCLFMSKKSKETISIRDSILSWDLQGSKAHVCLCQRNQRRQSPFGI